MRCRISVVSANRFLIRAKREIYPWIESLETYLESLAGPVAQLGVAIVDEPSTFFREETHDDALEMEVGFDPSAFTRRQRSALESLEFFFERLGFAIASSSTLEECSEELRRALLQWKHQCEATIELR